MRDPIENVNLLQKQLNDLQLENKILKNILDHSGISYVQELKRLKTAEEVTDYDPNQGARIIHPNQITDNMAVLFYSRFWGRQDVYAKRNEKKRTGEIGYFTQCHNFWQDMCPKKHKQKISCKDCAYRNYKQLKKKDILAHLRGYSYNASDVIGVYPLMTDGTCRFLVYDFDNHEKGAEQVNLKSLKYYDRMLPAQDFLPEGGVGNLIALPLQGKALLDGNSAFIDSSWNAYPNQWEVLWSKPKLSQEFLEMKVCEWSVSMGAVEISDDGERREKPWEKNCAFSSVDVDGKLSITLSNGIYVDNLNLKPSIQNKIRRMAAINNPIYYKNQAIGTSNFDTTRWIYLGQDHLSGYIEIPCGLYSELISNVKMAGINYEVTDERQVGRGINVAFCGELRDEQRPALAEIMRHDNGILHAATAFGKTVVCSAMIAEKKVNTLILLESSSLIEQWKDTLEKFLIIDEPLPEYQTKTGRVKTRTGLIGKLQGAHDSMTGIIDIAMAGSLCKKGKFHELLNQYGMIIVDECHHAASDRIASVLKEVKAKYVYGVTATPKRGDGLEKINDMLLGPIRYSYTAKEKAKAQGIDHLVYPRFTRVVPATETMILAATGKLVGEGFDYPRFGTLFMAMPVSFRGVVEQYADRLNRDYEGKKNVIVYDYVDGHIPMFDHMYAKRLKAYKQIGYDVCAGLQNEKQSANAIFDSENYFDVYQKDLLSTNSSIVISSPVISWPKINELIRLLTDQQNKGVLITIVTWAPDSYTFGDAGAWMQMHEELRRAGFYMKTVEEFCEHFAIIDQEFVWYGKMNLLGKPKVDDSMMRVQSKQIAAELMELTFGLKQD